jgi:hypothetical protein
VTRYDDEEDFFGEYRREKMKRILSVLLLYHVVLTSYIDCDCIARHVKKHEGDKYKRGRYRVVF